jgi:uncharacterized protein YgbK (DUF1537 family)
MTTGKILFEEMQRKFYALPHVEVDEELNKYLGRNDRKIIVLDDDPTGSQTLHDISVFTDWTVDSIEAGFSEEKSMFLILTNSRSFTAEETTKVHRDIAKNILEVSKRKNKDFIIISRSDSTLRGHYPLETQVLKQTIEDNSNIHFHGEIIFPFFKEGGRFTVSNIHYVLEEDFLIPAGETEFAKDKTFGYQNSNLGKYIEEKTLGEFKADDVQSISLESIRKYDIDGIVAQLLMVQDFNKVVVNALDYQDVKVFTIALLKAMEKGKRFIFRTAAGFIKVIGSISDKGLLVKNDIIKGNNKNNGLIIIGSHVNRTSEQLEDLKASNLVECVEFNQHLVINPPELNKEVERVIKICEKEIQYGRNVVIYTRRDRFDLGTKYKEEELKIAVRISDALTSIVQKLNVCPKFIIAKGGITSSDIGTKGLGIKRAIVAGQIKPGIPVWLTGNESKFPELPYIIFPGNVGTRTTLREVVEMLID